MNWNRYAWGYELKARDLLFQIWQDESGNWCGQVIHERDRRHDCDDFRPLVLVANCEGEDAAMKQLIAGFTDFAYNLKYIEGELNRLYPAQELA